MLIKTVAGKIIKIAKDQLDKWLSKGAKVIKEEPGKGVPKTPKVSRLTKRSPTKQSTKQSSFKSKVPKGPPTIKELTEEIKKHKGMYTLGTIGIGGGSTAAIKVKKDRDRKKIKAKKTGGRLTHNGDKFVSQFYTKGE